MPENQTFELLGVLAAFALAGGLSVALCRLMMSAGVVDAPSEPRKVQTHTVPTSGGTGFGLAALGAFLLCASMFDIAVETPAYIAAGGAMAVLLVGLLDDVADLAPKAKFLLMLAAAAAMATFGVRTDHVTLWPGESWALLPVAGSLGAVMWFLLVLNAVNFMDGANGLAMGMGAIASLALGACAAFAGRWDLALIALALCGALAGFLVWNVPGKLFAGDAGALFCGALLAGVSLLLVKERPDWLFIPPLILAPFLTDVLLTLVWRIRMGKPFHQPHRDHTYQIAIKARLSHVQVAGIHAVWALNAAAIGTVAAITSSYVPVLAFVAVYLVSAWVHIRVRISGVRAGLVGREIA
ncbi:MAG: MraY family glycosyltransferase [Hyphomonadaceae bacterium]